MVDAERGARILALVSSPLQRAVIDRAGIAREDLLIVGNRGMAGDLEYEQSVLNEGRFLDMLDRLIGEGAKEIFIPNSLCAAFYLCAAHPGVERIHFHDEGGLTKNFIVSGQDKPSHPLSERLASLFQLARRLPGSLRTFAYRLLARTINRQMVRPYVADTAAYPYRTLERRWKGGRVLSHARVNDAPDWIEHVDITKGIAFEKDLEGAACLFVHPRSVATDEQVASVVEIVGRSSLDFDRGLIRPHPMFSLHRDRRARLEAALTETGLRWSDAVISGRQEVSVELHARGVRTFILDRSSIEDTIAAYPEFFKDLDVIRFGSRELS